MFVDFLTLMLINLVAGLSQLTLFVYKGIDEEDKKRWIPGLIVSGSISLITGLAMIFTWPLPGSYNIAFGEMAVLFGAVLIALVIALAMARNFFPISIYSFFAGLAVVVVGIGIVYRGMTTQPALAAAAYLCVGVAGLLSPLIALAPASHILRFIVALLLAAGAALFAITGYGAYWQHLSDFSKWTPFALR